MIGEPATNTSSAVLFVRRAGLVAGPAVAGLIYWLLGNVTSSVSGGESAAGDAAAAVLSEQGRRCLAVAAWMAVWWMTEAIPVSATALLPLLLLPALGVTSMKAAAAPYADEIIALFLGGLMLGIAMEKSGLHRRIALRTLALVGTRPPMMIGGIMLATAVMSMWVSNTATTVMMLPIAASIIAMAEKLASRGSTGGARGAGGTGGDGWTAEHVRRFSLGMLLGIAYAASIGGIATPIGTPPNLVMITNAERLLGKQIAFVDWMKIGLPIVAILLPASWLLLTRVLYPVRVAAVEGGREAIRRERSALGSMSRSEWIVMGVFFSAVVWWLGRIPLCEALGLGTTKDDGSFFPWITDSTIAIAAALLLFILPRGRGESGSGGGEVGGGGGVITWEDAEKVPWGVLVLFGGGLSIAAAMGATGCDKYLGGLFVSLGGLPLLLVLGVLVVAVIAMGELASNTAMTAAMMPVLAAIGPAMGIDPMLLMVTAAVAASCGFMLPVATPPNAIVFSTGRIGMPQMMRSGVLLDVICAAVIVAAMWSFGPRLLEMVVK